MAKVRVGKRDGKVRFEKNGVVITADVEEVGHLARKLRMILRVREVEKTPPLNDVEKLA